MAADKLTWYFELIDRFTPSSNKILSSLNKLSSKFPTVTNVLSKVTSGMGRMFGGAAKAVGSGVSAIAGALTSLPGLIAGAAVTGLGIAGAKFAADTLSFKENSLVAFKTMLGSEEAAGRVFKQAVDFAAKTPFDTKEVITSFQKLLTAGFKESELDTVMRALGDVGASNGVEAMQSAQRAISQIMAKGRLQGEELMQLSEAGIGMGAVYDQLANSMGKSREEVQKLITAGKVDASTGVVAILEAINQTKSGGAGVGSLMQAQANTLTGVLSTLASRPSELLMAASSGPAMDAFKNAINKMTSLLDPESPMGKRIVAFITRIGNAFGAMFGSATEGDTLERVLGGVMDLLEGIMTIGGAFAASFGPAFSAATGPISGMFGAVGQGQSTLTSLTSIFGYFGKLLGFVVGTIATLIGLAVKLTGILVNLAAAFAPINEFLLGLVQRLFDIGVQIVAGLINGIASMAPRVAEAIKNIGGAAISSIKSALGIASPSKVMAEMGFYTGEGFALGLDRADMQGALDASMPIGPTASISGMAGAGSTTNNMAPSITLNVDAKGATAQDATTIAQTIKQVMLSEMKGAFEQMAIEVGA